MANIPVQGYPTSIGSKQMMMFDHTGPKSYGNIGTSSGTGDVINATDLGLGGFDSFEMAFGGFTEGYSASGNFIVKVFSSTSATTPAINIPIGGSFAAGSAFKGVVLQWFTTSAPFGAISSEVTNATDLSAEQIRLKTICV
jgi:hypothetical protein